MKNFKQSVPLLVQAKMHSLATEIQLAFSDVVTCRYEAYTEVRVDEIEGNYKSGWLPRQDGGFTVSTYVTSDIDSYYHLTEKQTEFVNEQAKDCLRAFQLDNKLDEDAEMSQETQEAYYEYEREWFADGAVIQIQIFASGYPGSWMEEKEQTITARVSVNYKDAPYFREGYAEDIKQLVLTEHEFITTPNSDIMKQITI